jgi:EAL domain-containing protein (putative c-di-GMP-specific phosphodiesterase class I)/GGDEF domain-containing protein
MMVPYCVSLFIIWLAPLVNDIHPLAFSILPESGYQRNYNFWFYLLCATKPFYVLVSISVVFSFRKMIPKSKIQIVNFYVISIAITSLMQLMHSELLIESFGMVLATLVYFFFIQKPEELVDVSTDTLNQTALLRRLRCNLTVKQSFSCIALYVDDTGFMASTFGIGQLNSFLSDAGTFLKQNFSYADVFSIQQGCFCIIVKDADEDKIRTIIAMIQQRFQKTWIHESVELKLYIRMCIINFPKDAETSEEIFDIINMISTDERYRQSVVFASEIDMKYRRRTIYIEHSLRNGLTENRFDVFYQPIYSTSEKKIIGAEALIRLKDESGIFISPEDFIPIAEKTGAILRIGEYVFESVCLTLSQIDIDKYGIKKIDINLSVAQCMQEILAEQILKINSIYQIPTSIINLEITETAAAHTPEILLKNMQELSNAGFELSLDDYGSGYSNMSYMLSLPFKMIKIDKYIVWAAFTDKRAEKALEATIKMIKSIGMTVLAEGVETPEQAEWLTKAGCDYLQGFYFSRPVPKKEFLDIMSMNSKSNDNKGVCL